MGITINENTLSFRELEIYREMQRLKMQILNSWDDGTRELGLNVGSRYRIEVKPEYQHVYDGFPRIVTKKQLHLYTDDLGSNDFIITKIN